MWKVFFRQEFLDCKILAPPPEGFIPPPGKFPSYATDLTCEATALSGIIGEKSFLFLALPKSY